jgi:DNA-directed RNA polymerase subunit alpha
MTVEARLASPSPSHRVSPAHCCTTTERTALSTRTSLMEFQIPRIVSETADDETHGVFAIEPLDRGFGYTFGNSLRRVLLSSLEGAAVTAVKIEGVAHEFTTLPGVREDVTDIILNLKNLVCRLHGESPEIEVHVSKKGPSVVTAADIEAPADLEILNPSLELAHVADKGKLEMTLTIGRGRGYVPAEQNRGPETSIGVVPIDSIFSPVRRVAYEVDAARVGQRTDYDKLLLDVTTDGSITPKDAIAQAAEILIRQLAIFTDLEKIEGFGEQGQAEAAEATTSHGMENFPIEELELGVRSYNCLKRVGIETIGDLTSKNEAELAAIPNFGRKSIDEVRETLATHGLTLKGEELIG